MGLFNKNKKKEVQEVESLPNLPNLPSIPQPPEMQNQEYGLPSYPNSDMGYVMNQNNAKEAIAQKGYNQVQQEYNPFQQEYNPIQQQYSSVQPQYSSVQPQYSSVQPQYSSVQPQYSSVQPQYSSVQPQMTKPLQDNVQFDDFKMMPKVFESTDWSSNQIALQPSINQSQLSTNQGVNINQSQVSPNQGIQIKKEEPIFIKLEKFENTISTFNEIKLRISEIETLLRTIKSIKQKEESELNEWENELEIIKSRLDQINQEMFKGI